MASYEISLNLITLKASADLSSKQYYFVKMGTTGVAANTSAGGFCEGIVQNKPTSGQAATVAVSGSVSKVIASAAITKGDPVASTNTGTAATATTGQIVLATALEAASAAGDIIPVLFQPGYAHA